MSVRYHDETQEIIEWYKNECPVDGEELNDDIDNDEHVPVRHSEDSTAIDSISGFNHGERGLDQNLSDDGYSTPEYQQYCLSVSEQQSTGYSYNSSIEAAAYKFTEREAYLMRNFIENMAQWVSEPTSVFQLAYILNKEIPASQADVADLERHFEIEAPRRALRQPVLRLAILAFSSRHVSRFSGYDETEALQYHTQCLQLLIPVLSAPDTEVSEDVLAAIAILRQYEEMDDYDKRCHLLGTTRILNSVVHFGSSGGLGEAAAWLCLREDIYASLVSQQPLRTRLETYLRSSTFQRNDDVSWANRMVFLLAKVLSCAFQERQQHTPLDGGRSWSESLQQVDQEVEDWKRKRPSTFEPILFKPPCSGTEEEQYRGGLPEVWMLAPFHAIGLQYYHIAKMVILATSVSPHHLASDMRSGYDCFQHVRRTEKSIREHLLIVLGIAVSNQKTAENTLFTARHALSVWGGCLRDKRTQDAAIAFLINMEKTTGWKSEPLIQSLKAQWEEDRSVSVTSLQP
ncbi:hypothetical protein T310_7771 [Rasamsonia emersonii CBS 393.64]|uniref:Zn(II)2Cys6 transcription factor n=1 Tax=Rasamsonia emersonii (strain ATCC 16479 / CBS 393.64 / IMI 116815) TaxID=1408163 RepID=A0A0F4YJK2_RASE3|nr:hypothetical protein T310_7771 [Rasamsonia emersonii CBS 393.64]KKA18280.1 hypothetical protein T310_7771 [Rasamsonia emersonii CBS 393.64]